MSNEDDISNYSFIKNIGEGNFGKVKLGINKKTGENYAIKIMSKEKIKTQIGKKIIPEIEIARVFNHKNVIRVYKILEDELNYYIIMEYCSKGELFDYIVSKQRLSKEEASNFFYQLINGIEYMHNKGYAHRDLKPENLLLTNNKVLKIIDFGLTHKYNEDMLLKTKCGSPSYAAPEILKGKQYDGFKSDIWCCGIILYAMLCGFLPFEGENNKILFKNIIKCKLELDIFDDENIKYLIKNILNPEPELRIDIEQIKKNEFYLKGEKLFNIMEKNNVIDDKHKISYSCNKKDLKEFKNNVITENDKNLKIKNLSKDKIDKLNYNLLNHKDDNSLNSYSRKIDYDKKTLNYRIMQTTKNAQDIISRHSNLNQQLYSNPYLKIFKKSKQFKDINKINLNEKIKKLLKSNHLKEEYKKGENKKNNMISNIRTINRDCFDINKFDSNIREEINSERNTKKDNFDSISSNTKLSELNNYISLKIKNKRSKYQNKLIYTEPLKYRSHGKKKKFDNSHKSYNLYKLISSSDKLSIPSSTRNKRNFYFENSKLNNKKKIFGFNDKFNEMLPLLTHHISKKKF